MVIEKAEWYAISQQRRRSYVQENHIDLPG